MRTDAVFKRAYNDFLDHLSDMPLGSRLDSEHAMARTLSISRTTVRKILETLLENGLVDIDEDQHKVVANHPDEDAFFPEDETEQAREIVEKSFMDLVLREEIRPGQHISTAELARQVGVSSSVVREYLSGFGQYGLIEKQPSGSWLFRGFDHDFAEELSFVRELFESKAAEAFGKLPKDHPAWDKLDKLEKEHREVLKDIETRYHEFSRLDQSFHYLIASAVKNRFFDQFNSVRAFIFHYHYQWNKSDELERNTGAIYEHLEYMDALRSGDRQRILATSEKHLNTARRNLMASIGRQ